MRNNQGLSASLTSEGVIMGQLMMWSGMLPCSKERQKNIYLFSFVATLFNFVYFYFSKLILNILNDARRYFLLIPIT